MKTIKLEESYRRGWGFPGLSRKAHYFIEGRSLCRRWMFMGEVKDTDDKSPDDCTDCTRQLANLRIKELTKKLKART